jgi:hypothetical protein
VDITHASGAKAQPTIGSRSDGTSPGISVRRLPAWPSVERGVAAIRPRV